MDRPSGRAYQRHEPPARHRKPEPTFFSSYSQATSDVPALRMSSAPSVRILSAPRSMEIWERRCFSAPLLAMTVDRHPFLKLTQFFSSYSQDTSDVPALRMSSAPSVRILSDR